MAAVADAKTVAAPFGNQISVVRVTYDFAVDGGAVGSLDLFTADGPLVIVGYYASVKTTCTSGGSATLDTGVSTDADLFVDGTAVASLTAGSIQKPVAVEGTPNVLPLPVYLADGAKATQAIAVAAFTAGKIEHVYLVMKA